MEPTTTIIQCQPYRIELDESKPRANLQGPQLRADFMDEQIKCGVMGKLAYQDMLKRVKQVGTERFCAFPFPKHNPTELWIFEAVRMAGLAIRQGKEELQEKAPQNANAEGEVSYNIILEDESLKQAKLRVEERKRDKLQKERYKRALRQFTMALKLQKAQKGETADLEQAIGQIQKERDLLKWKQSALLYLPDQKELEHFKSILESIQDEPDLYECFRQHVEAEADEQYHRPYYYWMQALIHERQESWLDAMNAYLQLSADNPCAMNCVEKAYTMLHKATLVNSQLQSRIKAIRMAFEQSIKRLNEISLSHPPSCFICFNPDEMDVKYWLETTFVPDLDLLGVKPIVRFRHLQIADDTADFQELARKTDLAVIVCTPDLKEKYEERLEAPVELAQEIRLIKGRYNDASKTNTIFPIFFKGTRKESLPTAYFEPIFGADFSRKPFKFHYFFHAFELFAAMRNVPREEARQLATEFANKVKLNLKGESNQF